MDILYINKVEEVQNDKNDFSKRSCKTMEHHRAKSSGTLQKWKNQGNCETGTQLADSCRCIKTS